MASTTDTKSFSHIETNVPSQTHPISLRILKLTDAESFVQCFADDPSNGPADAATAEKVITRMRDSAAEPSILNTADNTVISGPGRVNLAVALKSSSGEGDGQLIGLSGYGAIKNWEREGKKIRAGDAGVLLIEEYRGKGYAIEAMKLAVNWGFKSLEEGGLQLDLVTITTDEENEKMIKLAEEKLGLKGLSIVRDHEFKKGANEIYWELTKAVWEDAISK